MRDVKVVWINPGALADMPEYVGQTLARHFGKLSDARNPTVCAPTLSHSMSSTNRVGVSTLRALTGARRTLAALAVAALAQIGGATYAAMSTYAAEVKNINDLQVRTGLWLAAHTAPDARVATNDIGAIAYFSRRFILDTEGLITPDAIWDKRMWRIDRFLVRSKPDVVVIFPAWYPYLAERGGFLHEVTRISAHKVIAGGESLVIYRTIWTRPGRLSP